MRKLGFANRWINLIIGCISTVSFSVMVNGNDSAPFNPNRGLRQGDPLSLYIFILCSEGLVLYYRKQTPLIRLEE